MCTAIRSLARLTPTLLLLQAAAAWADRDGVSGYSGRLFNCTLCHTPSNNVASASATVTGPSSLSAGATAIYMLTLTGGPGQGAGLDVSTDTPGAALGVIAGQGTRLSSGEVVHSAPKAFEGGAASFQFRLTAPKGAGTVRLYAAALSTNGSGRNGDRTETVVFPITVTEVPPNQPPTVAQPASATSPVTGLTAQLDVLGADDGGEADLRYTWAANNPPAPVSFSPNGTNAAKRTTVTFGKAGSYTFTVTVRDAAGASVTSSVSVAVQQTLTSLIVAPANVGLTFGGQQQFTAAARDQFSNAMPAPAVSWSAPSSAGTITSSGLFTAGTLAGGPHTVTASAQGKTGSASVTVSAGAAPTLAQAPSANPSTVTGTTTTLSVLGADQKGEGALRYTWDVASGAAGVTFNPNGTNAAKTTTVTFPVAGVYGFTVTIRNASNLTTTGSVNVTVTATAAGIALSPQNPSVEVGASQLFMAAVLDQFGQPMGGASAVGWSVAGGGTIDGNGLFTAASTPSGPHAVTATVGGVTSSTQVTVVAKPSTPDEPPPTPPSLDQTAPQVSWVSPALGAVLSGTAALQVTAVDDVGVREVTYFLDDQPIGKSTEAPWLLALDTRSAADGPHALEAVAVDAAGNSTRAGRFTVRIANATEGLADENAVTGGCSSIGGPGWVLPGLLALLVRRRRAVSDTRRRAG